MKIASGWALIEDCARILGYRDVIIQKRNGGDQRLAMACAAALRRIKPYE